MTFVLLLMTAVALVVAGVAAVVASRAAAGHGLEDEIVAGADREPWAAPVAEDRERIAA